MRGRIPTESVKEGIVAADSALSRELEALKEELAVLHRKRRTPPADRKAASEATAKRSEPPQHAAEDHQHLHGELRDLVKLVTEYVEEAETNLAAHPTATVVGALVVGILIGRALGRR
jgi:ElaB/YqjD/DUF883 family membrane-anchored ribosome-binding protein